MKSSILVSMIFLISLSFSSASIIISPNPVSVSTTVGQQNNYSITINNSFNFTLTDFSFSNLTGFSFPNITIPANSNQTFTFSVNTNSSFHGTINSNVQFNYLVNLPETVTNYNLTITSNGFSQNYITVRSGDSITFKNIDSITHSIFSTTFGTITIPSNSSSSYTFNQIGTFNFYDTAFQVFNNYNGNIQVVSRTLPQEAHNPNYDVVWSVNLDSSLNPTNLSVSNSGNNFSIAQNTNAKGLITIQNIGGITSENITLSSDSDWVTFDHNNFNLNSGLTDWSTYTITPIITATNQTNQTYTINLFVSSFNSQPKNFTVSVFIPYYEVLGGFTSDVGGLTYLINIFCPAHPCSILCDSKSLPQCNPNGTFGSGTSNITANITSYDLYNALRNQASLKDEVSRLENTVSDFTSKNTQTLSDLQMQGNQSLQMSQQAKDEQTSRTISVSIGAFFIFLIGASIILIIRQSKIKEKQSYGGMNYKKET